MKLMLGSQHALQMLGIRVLIGQEDSTANAAPLQAALACGPIRVCSKEASQFQPAALLVEELRGQISGSKPDVSWQALNNQVQLLFTVFLESKQCSCFACAPSAIMLEAIMLENQQCVLACRLRSR